MKTIALIPARIGSKGVPGKNFRALNGRSCLLRAIDCAREAGIDQIVVSSDRVEAMDLEDGSVAEISGVTWLGAYAPLHTDGCAMIEIVRDAVERVPGAPEDIWVLLQPSSPLRTKNQITTAIDLLKFTGSDSVVTVRRAVSCDALLTIDFIAATLRGVTRSISATPRRQRQQACFVRDGTAYVFWRRTVRDFDHIYGVECRPMIINDEQSLSIDTPQDWSEAERRLKAIENARLAS